MSVMLDSAVLVAFLARDAHDARSALVLDYSGYSMVISTSVPF